MSIRQRSTRFGLAAGLALGTLAFAGPTFVLPDGAAAATVAQDGPHSPAGRVPAATTVSTSAGISLSRYDLGDVEVGSKPGQYRAPLRGSLLTPTASTGRSKLVIVSHLRSAGCAGDVFAFPCPGKEVRYDRGMEYFGRALAAQGYTVLIPDVAPVWIGSTLQAPYDQTKAWLTVMGRTRQALADDVAGSSNHFHLPLKGRVDLSGAGFVVHSRSGFIAGPAITAWRHGPTPITSVLAYGPAYDVPDAENHVTAPVAGDVPYLGLVGDADNDVPFNANLWLSGNITQKRTAMAAVATVPGLGHDYINQALSSAGTDDRLNCTPATCATAAQHEHFLVSAAEDYFGATMRGRSSTLPLAANSTFPATVGGLSARWLAVTDSIRRVTLVDADAATPLHVSKGSTSVRCRFYDPQDPRPYTDKCTDPKLGTVELVSHVHHVTLAKGGTVTIPTHLTGASAINVQITPYDDRADKGSSSPLTVTVTTQDGTRTTLPMPANAASVLANRATSDTNGTYLLGTLRIPIPASLRGATITSVELTAPKGGEYALRSVDAIASNAPGTSVTPKPKPTGPSAPSTHSPTPSTSSKPSSTPTKAPASSAHTTSGVTGPLVQTDDVPNAS